MLAGIGSFIDDSRSRFVLSLAVIASFHAVMFYYMNMTVVMSREKAKLITNVEIMQMEPAKAAVVEEQPKNVWEKIKQIMPFSKAEEGPRPTAQDSMKKLLEEETIKPPKLVDKAQPLSELDKSQLDDLKRQRDQKLTELMDMTGGAQPKVAKLMTQEQALTESSKPIIRPTMGIDKTIAMEEVGAKRSGSGNISDVINSETSRKNAGIEAPVSQLVEKKAELKKQLAALNSMAPDRLEDRSGSARPGSGELKEIVGSVQERKTAQELIALEKLIQEKEPSSPKAGGSGGFGFAGSGSGLGGAEAIKLNEPKEQPIARKPEVPDVNAMAGPKTNETVAEIKKAPVEITGPLQNRKVLQAFVPKYPDWAKSKEIEADVSLRFFVNPQGIVNPDISVVITSGYRELDQMCIDNLKKWVFAPLGADQDQIDQWGVITIRFRLD